MILNISSCFAQAYKASIEKFAVSLVGIFLCVTEYFFLFPMVFLEVSSSWTFDSSNITCYRGDCLWLSFSAFLCFLGMVFHILISKVFSYYFISGFLCLFLSFLLLNETLITGRLPVSGAVQSGVGNLRSFQAALLALLQPCPSVLETTVSGAFWASYTFHPCGRRGEALG